MGLRIKLPVTFTDPTLPKNRADPFIADGSLFLVDFGRASVTPTTSVPAHGASLGNLAWETAADVIGSGDESTLAGTFENTLVGVPEMGVVERTGRYGVHIINSQTAADSAARYGAVVIPAPVVAYIRANLPSHTFYFSMWGRQTRLATATADAIAYLGDTANGNNCAFSFYKHPARAPGDGTSALVGALAEPTINATGNFFRAIAADDWTGTKPSAPNTVGKFWFGAQGPYVGFQRNGAASGIIYRIAVEDLTASGRTWPQAVAADKALYDAAFAPGGRFYGDTFRAPSEIP